MTTRGMSIETKDVLAILFRELIDALPNVDKIKETINSWITAYDIDIWRVKHIKKGETMIDGDLKYSFIGDKLIIEKIEKDD